MHTMDTTIRNLDEQVYRELKARAALQGKTVGEVLTEAIRAWLAGPNPWSRSASLSDLHPQSWGAGTDRSSEQIDKTVYGVQS